MSFNLRNRSLLTVQDYTQREFRYLLDLARDLKRAKYARTEQKHLDGKEICLIFEKTSTRTRCAFEVACYDQGAQRHLSRPGRLADRPQGIVQGHRARARPHVRRASSIAARARPASKTLAKYAGVPVYNGLTDEYHPTQMLADVMTMREHSDKPIPEIKYAFVGDTRNNMGHSLMIVGCLMGMDVRICGPKTLWPADEYVDDRARAGEEVRREADHHRRPEEPRSRASTSSTPTSGCRWASRRRSGRSASSC